MTLERIPSLEEFEAQVKANTAARHRKEINLVEKLLNRYLAGFREIDKFTPSKDNELEYAWLLLTTRSFNSLRCAFELLQKGYYSQSMMLIRSVDEDYLICRDCQTNPETLNALLKGGGKLRKGKLSYAEMAKRISDKFYDEVWKDNYGQESEIAHASQMALKILIDPDTNILMLGSHYNNTLFVATCHALLRIAVGMTEFLSRLVGAKQWQIETLSTVQAANTEIARISGEVKELNQKKMQ